MLPKVEVLTPACIKTMRLQKLDVSCTGVTRLTDEMQFSRSCQVLSDILALTWQLLEGVKLDYHSRLFIYNFVSRDVNG